MSNRQLVQPMVSLQLVLGGMQKKLGGGLYKWVSGWVNEWVCECERDESCVSGDVEQREWEITQNRKKKIGKVGK